MQPLSISALMYLEFQHAFHRSYLATEEEKACHLKRESQELTHYGKNDGKNTGSGTYCWVQIRAKRRLNWPEKDGPPSIGRTSGFCRFLAEERSQRKNADKNGF